MSGVVAVVDAVGGRECGEKPPTDGGGCGFWLVTGGLGRYAM